MLSTLLAVLVRLWTSSGSGRADSFWSRSMAEAWMVSSWRRHRGDDVEPGHLVHRHVGHVRVEVEVDVEVAGQEVAGLELGPQAAPDQRLHGGGRHRLAGVGVDRADALRLDLDRGLDDEGLALVAVGETDVRHRADPDAADLDRGALLEPAGRAVELDQERHATAGVRLRGGVRVGVEGELGVGGRGRGVVGGGRGLELDAADQEGLHRGHVDLEPAAVGRDVEPARVPEPGLLVDELVVGGLDEHVDLERLALVGGELVAQHLPGLDAAVVDRGAAAERAQRVGAQHEGAARLAGADLGRVLEPGEVARVVARAGVDLDVGAETSVPRPETPPVPTRGRTIQ